MKRKLNISTVLSLATAILFLIAGIFYVVSVCMNWNPLALASGLADFAFSGFWFFIFSMMLKRTDNG